jgi:hypothetical protein
MQFHSRKLHISQSEKQDQQAEAAVNKMLRLAAGTAVAMGVTMDQLDQLEVQAMRSGWHKDFLGQQLVVQSIDFFDL